MLPRFHAPCEVIFYSFLYLVFLKSGDVIYVISFYNVVKINLRLKNSVKDLSNSKDWKLDTNSFSTCKPNDGSNILVLYPLAEKTLQHLCIAH